MSIFPKAHYCGCRVSEQAFRLCMTIQFSVCETMETKDLRFEARPLTDDDEAAWEALWKRSERHLALHWHWTSCAARGVGVPRRIGLFSKSGQLLAGAAFVERRGRFRPEWHHPAPTPFGGLLCEQSLPGESSMREIFECLSAAVARQIPQAEMILQPAIQDVRGLLWTGWTSRPHYNYVSRIDAADALQRDAENAVRRQAARAESLGMTFETGAHILPEVLNLWDRTRQRQGVPSYIHHDCYTSFVKITGFTKEEGLSSLVAGIRDPETGELEAGAVIGRDPKRVYYLMGASETRGEELGTGAPTVLHFRVTELMWKESGDFLYDWVGANTAPVAQFKKKFRPTLECYHRVSFKKKVFKKFGR